MFKIAIVLVILCVMFRWALGQWPWQMLDARPTREQAAYKARRLLDLQEGASRTEILAAHRRVLARVHPDRGGTNDKVHAANEARDLLLKDLPASSRQTDDEGAED